MVCLTSTGHNTTVEAPSQWLMFHGGSSSGRSSGLRQKSLMLLNPLSQTVTQGMTIRVKCRGTARLVRGTYQSSFCFRTSGRSIIARTPRILHPRRCPLTRFCLVVDHANSSRSKILAESTSSWSPTVRDHGIIACHENLQALYPNHPTLPQAPPFRSGRLCGSLAGGGNGLLRAVGGVTGVTTELYCQSCPTE